MIHCRRIVARPQYFKIPLSFDAKENVPCQFGTSIKTYALKTEENKTACNNNITNNKNGENVSMCTYHIIL